MKNKIEKNKFVTLTNEQIETISDEVYGGFGAAEIAGWLTESGVAAAFLGRMVVFCRANHNNRTRREMFLNFFGIYRGSVAAAFFGLLEDEAAELGNPEGLTEAASLASSAASSLNLDQFEDAVEHIGEVSTNVWNAV